MSIVNKWVLSVCFSVVILLAQVIVSQWMWMSHLRQQLELSNEARKIQNEQIRDLMVQLDTAKDNNAAVASQQFISGILAATQRPDYYNEIWHSGYDRGTAVQRYLADVEKETTYTKEER